MVVLLCFWQMACCINNRTVQKGHFQKYMQDSIFILSEEENSSSLLVHADCTICVPEVPDSMFSGAILIN